jgi:cytochrome P450
LISDADALKQILVSKSFKYHRPVEAERVSFFPHKNVLLANGKDHSRMRKMVNPAFKVNNLKYMVVVFYEKAKLLAKVNKCVLFKRS